MLVHNLRYGYFLCEFILECGPPSAVLAWLNIHFPIYIFLQTVLDLNASHYREMKATSDRIEETEALASDLELKVRSLEKEVASLNENRNHSKVVF
jgi:hypothetical protein